MIEEFPTYHFIATGLLPLMLQQLFWILPLGVFVGFVRKL